MSWAKLQNWYFSIQYLFKLISIDNVNLHLFVPFVYRNPPSFEGAPADRKQLIAH